MAALHYYSSALHSLFTSHYRTQSRPPHRLLPKSSSSSSSQDQSSLITRRQLISESAIAISVSSFVGGGKYGSALAAEEPLSEWERVFLPIDPGVVLLDIAFVPDDPKHGFLLGTRQTILETKDGGNTWVPRSISSAEEEDFNYRFNSISFKGKEGWIVGKPAILLYTSDAGETWQRIPLSSQLPGDMLFHGGGSTKRYKEERPRFFDSKAKNMCWDKAERIPSRHPDRWRIDAAGNLVCKHLHSCNGCLCYEYDHIIPFSKGGESVAENCQILQTRANRLKSDNNGIDTSQLKGYSCDLKFSDDELDIIEMAVYGNVMRPGKQCRVGSIDAMLGKYKSKDLTMTCKLPQNEEPSS